MSRPTKDEYFLGIAKAVAARSTCRRRNYGAVIVKNGVIVSTGYNGSCRYEDNCCDSDRPCARESAEHNTGYTSDCPAVHAEMNAIINGNRSDMAGATLYLYGQEADGTEIDNAQCCVMCQRVIRNAMIAHIVTKEKLKGFFD